MFIKGLLPLQSLRLKPKGAFSVGTFGSSVGSTYIHASTLTMGLLSDAGLAFG